MSLDRRAHVHKHVGTEPTPNLDPPGTTNSSVYLTNAAELLKYRWLFLKLKYVVLNSSSIHSVSGVTLCPPTIPPLPFQQDSLGKQHVKNNGTGGVAVEVWMWRHSVWGGLAGAAAACWPSAYRKASETWPLYAVCGSACVCAQLWLGSHVWSPGLGLPDTKRLLILSFLIAWNRKWC